MDKNIEIMLVPPDAIDVVWDSVLPLIAKPIEMSRGCFLPEDVLALLRFSQMDLFIAIKGEEVLAAYVVNVRHFPRKRVLETVFAGGKPHSMSEWLEPMVSHLDAVGKQTGCAGMMATGRKGWSRIVEGEEVAIVLWRDLPVMELHS